MMHARTRVVLLAATVAAGILSILASDNNSKGKCTVDNKVDTSVKGPYECKQMNGSWSTDGG